MTRKDLVALAQALKYSLAQLQAMDNGDITPEHAEAFAIIVKHVSNTCERSNARFDHARFQAACGL